MADENDLNIGVNVNPTGAEVGSKRAKTAVQGIAGGAKELEVALNKLRSSIDPTFAAMQKYNKAHADNLALKRAGLITNQEYIAGMKAAKVALESEIAAIQAKSQASSAAAKREEAAMAKAEAARKKQVESIRALATEAKKAAAAAESAFDKMARPRTVGKVGAGTIDSSRTVKQLENDIKRASEAAARYSQMATQKAAEAAEASSASIARSATLAANKAAAAAEEYAGRVTQLMRTKASVVGAAEKAEQAAIRETEAARKRAAADAIADAAAKAKAEQQASQAAQEMRAAIDPAYAAQMRYNQTMRQATQLLMTNKLQQGEWNAIQRQARAQMDLNVRSLGQQNAMYVQLGYQAQDVTASLASGINPLVILAQQGGQTAAALSTMGGTIGRVAAFMAGPWGAAIIGATLLLGYLWDSIKGGEEATKDLMNAEDRRRMTVEELTKSIDEYIKSQREANETTLQGALNTAYATAEARNRIFTEMAEAEAALERATQDYQNSGFLASLGADAVGLYIRMLRAKSAVDALRESYDKAVEASGEARAAYIQTTSDMTQNEINEQSERTAALGRFRQEWKAAGSDMQKQSEAAARYQARLNQLQEHYTKLKKAEEKARKDNEAAAKSEAKAVFQSREDAIQRLGKDLIARGYSDQMQNFGVGDKKVGQHPGMGRVAHGKYAIDVNIPGAGGTESSNPVYRAQMDKEVLAAQAAGYRILWNGRVYEPHGGGPRKLPIPAGQNQHTGHAHIEAPKSIVGKPAGTGLAGDLVRQAEELANEERRIAEERLRDRVSEMEFEQELNRENISEVLRIQAEKIAALTEFYGAESREVMNAQRERVRLERRQAQELLQEQRENIDQRLALMMEGLDREQELKNLNRDDRSGVIDFAEQQGVISAREALIARAAILDEEYRQLVAHEDRMFQEKVAAKRAELALENLPLAQKEAINREIERMEAEHLTRMAVMNGNYTNQVSEMQRRAAEINMQKWREFASSFTGSMTSAFQGLWTRSITMQQAFINMADQQVYRLVDMGAKALENWIMQQLKMTGAQQAAEAARTAATTSGEAARTGATAAGNAARVGIATGAAATETGVKAAVTTAAVAGEAIQTGAKVAGEATRTSVGATGAIAEIGTRAATSAAGAFSSTVVIPFIGPVAAPVAAAAALAAVLGFGALVSSSGGQGEVPRDGQLSLLHKKETVLPAWIAEPMRRMFVSPRSSGLAGSAASAGSAARSETSNSSNPSFYYQPKHTNMGADMETLLRRDGRTLRKWFMNEVRNGSLKLP